MENIPLKQEKTADKKDENNLPLYKQIITTEYKTITAVNDKHEKNEDEENDENNNEENDIDNDNIDNINEKDKNKIEEKSKNKDIKGKGNKDMRYMDILEEEEGKDKNIKKGIKENKDTKGNKDTNLKQKNNAKGGLLNKEESSLKSKTGKAKAKANEQTSQKAEKKSEEKNINQNQQNKKSAKTEKKEEKLDSKKNLKKSKNEEENTKDISANMKNIYDLYEKIVKSGKKSGEEAGLNKLADILLKFDNEQLMEILEKLLKSFPKSAFIKEKLLFRVREKEANNIMSKAKSKEKQKDIKNAKISSNNNNNDKDIKLRSVSQTKTGQKKNKFESESYENKSEFNKKIRHQEGGKEHSSSHNDGQALSAFRYGAYSVNNANIGTLKFDGLFLDISKYGNMIRDKNPFEGPSSFEKFYRVRKTEIKKKIISMTNEGKNENEENEK